MILQRGSEVNLYKNRIFIHFLRQKIIFNIRMNPNIYDNPNTNLSLQNRALIPPIFYKNKIYLISNPKLFLVLYKIGMLANFMDFSEINGYDEIKKWLKKRNLLNDFFLENVSLYCVPCKIKYPSKIRFFAKNPLRIPARYELN